MGKSIFITDVQFQENQKAVQLFINTIRSFRNKQHFHLPSKDQKYMSNLIINSKFVDDQGKTSKISDNVMRYIMLNVLPKSKLPKTQEEIDSCGTAMFPVANNFWVIGSLGSIWLDVIVDDTLYRVAFYNKKPYPSILITN